jgi:hypothetical protein
MPIPNIPRAVLNLTAARLRHAAHHWHGVSKELARAGRHLRRQQEIVQHAPAHARRRIQRSKAAMLRTRNRWARFDDHVLQPYAVERRVKRRLARAASGSGPIVVGPWTSEVGYEALYWIPFLHWAIDHYRIDPRRVIAISRGGTEDWYRGIARHYVDIFDCIGTEAFAAEMRMRREHGDQKQSIASPLDNRLVSLAADRLGLPAPAVWHPGLMYELLRAFWYGDRALQFLLRHTDFRRARTALALALREPAHGLPVLPAEYVAVKFYTGPSLPNAPEVRAALVRAVERLAARMPVVMLDTAWTVDEHQDYTFDHIRGVTTLRPSLDPRTNLQLQTRVIAGAQLFVGTCGGLAWLAPLLGVETVAVYEDDRFLTPHLHAARYAYRYSGAATFSTLNLRALSSGAVRAHA